MEAEEHGEGHDDGEEEQRQRGPRRRHAPPPTLASWRGGGGRRSQALHPARRTTRSNGVGWPTAVALEIRLEQREAASSCVF